LLSCFYEVKSNLLYKSEPLFLEGVAVLAETVADEIRAKEAGAREIIANAKTEGARLIASARTSGEQALKEARQKSHRYFREEVRRAENEAEAAAARIVEEGKAEAEQFYVGGRTRVAEVSSWLVKKVMSVYGD
jgi:vacuolar-type H+-ATPase subunit H